MPTNVCRLPLGEMLHERDMTDTEISAIQSWLRHFGYLQDRFGALHDGEYDPATEKAVRLYQACFGLPPTGQMDQATLSEMARPRCGVPDIGPASAAFTTVSSWDKRELTYQFTRFSSQLAQTEVERDVAAAFTLWSESCDLDFRFAPDATAIDMAIEFAVGEHGDGNDFDGPSGVLAHAYFPPPAGGELAGDTHFDDAENWTTDLTDTSAIDFLTVAAHEFGHAIGLGHSRQRDALMFPSYLGPHRFLAADDIAGCQSLYGPPMVEDEPSEEPC